MRDEKKWHYDDTTASTIARLAYIFLRCLSGEVVNMHKELFFSSCEDVANSFCLYVSDFDGEKNIFMYRPTLFPSVCSFQNPFDTKTFVLFSTTKYSLLSKRSVFRQNVQDQEGSPKPGSHLSVVRRRFKINKYTFWNKNVSNSGTMSADRVMR